MNIPINCIAITAMSAVAALSLAFSSALQAQSSKQIPRTPAGKPNFTGLWAPPAGGGGSAATRAQIIRELPLTAWGKERAEYTIRGDGEFPGETGAPEDPRFHSLCGSASSPANVGGRMEIHQNPHRLFLVYFGDVTRMWARQFWIGREHPNDPTDYEPTWMGHSVAKWDGDTLVVDTIRAKGGTLIDRRMAAPQSDEFHMVERYRFTDPETMRVDRTFEDPKAYTRPWSNSKTYKLQTDWDEIAGEWEVLEQHTICEGGTYPVEHDPWFDSPSTPAR
jgi:hypothetical protein